MAPFETPGDCPCVCDWGCCPRFVRANVGDRVVIRVRVRGARRGVSLEADLAFLALNLPQSSKYQNCHPQGGKRISPRAASVARLAPANPPALPLPKLVRFLFPDVALVDSILIN